MAVPLSVKDETGSDVAQFITKVWNIVNSSDTNHLVKWTESGKTFVVIDVITFSKEILPHYFKHNNFASFVRQLNLYGFRKVAKPDQGALVKVKDESVEFWHANFRRDHPELLHLVQRRAVASRTGMEEKNPYLSQVINDIHQMKGRHESIDTLLNDLKRENSHLRQEITILKEKHKYQHKLMNKIIHFIVHILYKGRLPTRKTNRLMLTDGEDLYLPRAKKPKQVTDPLTIASYDVESPPPSAKRTYSPPVSAGASTVTFPSTSTANDDPSQHMTISALSSDDFLADLLSPPVSNSQAQILDPILPPLPAVTIQSQSIVSPPPPTISEPSSLVQPSIENTTEYCPLNTVNCHLDNQEQSILSLHDVIPGQLSIDPTIMSDFLSNEYILPEYDLIDTARLLEALANDDPRSDVPHEDSVSQNAIVPYSASSTTNGNSLLELLTNNLS